MVTMKIEAKKKKVVSTVDIVTIDGIEVDAYRFLECLEALEGTLRPLELVRISNPNVEKILLRYKLAWKSNRGTWSQYLNTGKIARFKKKIYEALDKMRPPRAQRL